MVSQMRKSLLLLILYACLTSSAYAQLVQRHLPANGERARTGAAQPLPLVQVGGKVLRLAPGGVIFDQQNRTVVHAHLPAGADVLYTKDSNGDVHRIYVLTSEEQARLARKR
jgi:hypothetical protein